MPTKGFAAPTSPEAKLEAALRQAAPVAIEFLARRLPGSVLGKLLERAAVDPRVSVESLAALLLAPGQEGEVIAPSPRVNALIRATHASRPDIVAFLVSGLDVEEVIIAFRGSALSTRADAGMAGVFASAADLLAPFVPIGVLDALPSDVLERLPHVQALRRRRALDNALAPAATERATQRL